MKRWGKILSPGSHKHMFAVKPSVGCCRCPVIPYEYIRSAEQERNHLLPENELLHVYCW